MALTAEAEVKLYFSIGLNHKEILSCLAHLNNIIISMRTLRRLLKKIKLFRRRKYSDLIDVSLFITGELGKHGGLYGYKSMHLSSVCKGLVVKEENVRLLLQILDPEGVSLRRKHRLRRRLYQNKGPNYM